MNYFNFNSLIKKYICDFEVITKKTEYDTKGDKVTCETSVAKRGAIISVSERKLYRSDGVLTEKDKELFMTEELGEITNAFVLYDGNKYSVELSPQNNHQFTGVWQYTLKWVSAFD